MAQYKKLLFITRKYPPMVGGMERMSYGLAHEFQKQIDTTIIAWTKPQKFLPLFLTIAFIKSLYFIPTKRITHLHLGDGLLSPLGLLLKILFGLKTTVTIAGLDITYPHVLYQSIVPFCVSRLDKVICISRATREECINRGISPKKCEFIPVGIYPSHFVATSSKSELQHLIKVPIANKKVLVTAGRLVKRKGVYWFIKNVLPKLGKNVLYVVVGNGPEKENIEHLVSQLRLHDRVLLLGKLPDEALVTIYNTADIFVMPNILIKNDIEGFGIVALEAAAAGLPVVATKAGGIVDAVKHNKTGLLVEAGKPDLLARAISQCRLSKEQVKQYINAHYAWPIITKRYLQVLN